VEHPVTEGDSYELETSLKRNNLYSDQCKGDTKPNAGTSGEKDNVLLISVRERREQADQKTRKKV
jgi:hypothetical protein